MSKLSARFSVYRAATLVSGHRPRLSAITPHSASTTTLNAAAQSRRLMSATTGSATTHPAITTHTHVCSSLMAIRDEAGLDSFIHGQNITLHGRVTPADQARA